MGQQLDRVREAMSDLKADQEVRAHTRKTKSGKIVLVRQYNRKAQRAILQLELALNKARQQKPSPERTRAVQKLIRELREAKKLQKEMLKALSA